MAARVIWSPRATNHLDAICAYIAQDSEVYAAIFAEKVLALVRTLPQFPESGRIVPEYNDPLLREKIYGNYRIVYRLKEDVIEIAAICHGARPITDVL